MSEPVRANRRGLRIAGAAAGTSTVDIYFDGHRVWSTRLPPPQGRTGVSYLPWPRAVAAYLRGTSTLTIRDSATGDEIASAEVRFGGPGRVRITDAQDRWLAIDKWNRLGPYFEGNESGVQGRLLDSAAQVAAHMQRWGYPVYIVGGSLLGAERSGALLPHDDDIDLAFCTDRSDPQDIILVGFELERQLTAAGFTVVRHSHTHLELVFFTSEGSIDYYIDIFTGYYSEDGLYNQPFALRGELPPDRLLPTKPVEVNGVALPAPASPETWLAYAYGPQWRVPDPSFRFVTPPATLRRFENSFGVFNRQRVWWEKTWQQVDKRAAAAPTDFADVDAFLRLLPEHAFVVDLGCGDGRHAERIAAAGHEVVGVDYSFEALRVARQTQPARTEYRFLNLNDRHDLLRFGLELIDQGRRPYFFARDVLHQVPPLGRADLFVLLRGMLDTDTFLYGTFAVTRVDRVAANPETWSLSIAQLRREAWRRKLGTTVLSGTQRDTPYGRRHIAAALIWK